MKTSNIGLHQCLPAIEFPRDSIEGEALRKEFLSAKHYLGGPYDAYKHPSKKKVKAYYAIQDTMLRANGYLLRIMTKNTYTFTCGYFVRDESGREWIVKETPHNRYCVLWRDKGE